MAGGCGGVGLVGGVVGTVILDPATIERLAWTLIHCFWQGILIAAALALAMALMRRCSSHARYAVLCAGLVAASVASPAVTFWWLGGTFDDPGPLVLVPDPLAPRPDASHGAPAAADAAAAPTTIDMAAIAARVASAIRPWTNTILCAWAAGALALAARQLIAWAWLQRLLRRDTAVLDATRCESLSQVAQRLRLARVRFRESRFLDVPATVGWLKPVVLLPAAALSGLSAAHLEAIVAHELAHIRRRDYLVNLLQTAAEVLMFYNPAIWWISNRVREEREHCCDDIAAAAATGIGGGRAVAEALLTLEEGRAASSVPELAMASTGGTLWRRIARLVGAPRELGSRRRRAGLLGFLLTISVLAAGTSHVLGSAVVVRPVRDQHDLRSTCGAVYEILELEDGEEGAYLSALSDAVGEDAAFGSAMSDEMLVRFASVVAAKSRADELARIALPRIRASRPFAFEHESTWRYGTFHWRVGLSERLFDLARKEYHLDSRRAAALARASLIVAAQDSFMLGIPRMYALLEEPDFAEIAQLTRRQEARLRRHVADHQTISRACAPLLAQVRGMLAAAPSANADGLPGAADLAFCDALRFGGSERYDVQLAVAKLAAEVRNAAGGGQVLPALGETSANMPYFTRWIRETDENTERVRRPRRELTLEDIQRSE